ncbi:MAG: hypothetical protein RLZZ502_134 [Pseudomonadota bacterium]|jgi:rhodanese-related sulfurtransferase
MPLSKTVAQLVAQAETEIETLSAAEALAQCEAGTAHIVDIRDVRELWVDGKVKGALHAPRGMLEFWVDPESPYHRTVFASGKKFILYCAKSWRSALETKTLQDMGFGPVAHIGGGYEAYTNAGLPTEVVEPKLPKNK